MTEKKDPRKSPDARKRLGAWGEDAACKYLQRAGYGIVARNFKAKTGEIDMVAVTEGVLVFVEVKTRSNFEYGQPCEAVNREKQTKIRRTAEVFLRFAPIYQNFDLRFDVIEIVKEPEKAYLRHLKSAF